MIAKVLSSAMRFKSRYRLCADGPELAILFHRQQLLAFVPATFFAFNPCSCVHH
jgi:hypothetical protein